MSTDPKADGNTPKDGAPRRFVPFVPEITNLKEMTLRAVILGLVMTVILGAANAYLGLKAGMTIAATYPAAIIGMAVLRLFKGSILEENIARTVGLIGESIAAGAVFTIPAFYIAEYWTDFSTAEAWASLECPDDRRRFSGYLFRDAAASRHGGRQGPSLPGIDRGRRDP